jgi:5-methyltetrahydrofolate--homocysteine methyltransferase
MANMQKSVTEIREKYPDTKILIGGAPVNREFCEKIGADFYSPDPQKAAEYLNRSCANG